LRIRFFDLSEKPDLADCVQPFNWRELLDLLSTIKYTLETKH